MKKLFFNGNEETNSANKNNLQILTETNYTKIMIKLTIHSAHQKYTVY